MTSLPSGLASISSQFDDSPQVRGAVAFGRAQADRREDADRGTLGWYGLDLASSDLTSAIDRHAALVIGSGYKGRDER